MPKKAHFRGILGYFEGHYVRTHNCYVYIHTPSLLREKIYINRELIRGYVPRHSYYVSTHNGPKINMLQMEELTMSEMEWLKIFANNLVYYLQENGMSQSELARMSGLEQGSISRYASAQQMPGVKAIINIANALGVSTDDLIDFGSMIY